MDAKLTYQAVNWVHLIDEHREIHQFYQKVLEMQLLKIEQHQILELPSLGPSTFVKMSSNIEILTQLYRHILITLVWKSEGGAKKKSVSDLERVPISHQH